MKHAASISGAFRTMARMLNEMLAGSAPPSKTRQRKQAERARRMKLRGEVTITQATAIERRKRYERWIRNKLSSGRPVPNHIQEKGSM